MACARCKQKGKEPKVYRYATPDGRWRQVETCEHQTKRKWRQTPIRRKQSGLPRRKYTIEQDRFILANYNTEKRQNRRLMQEMTARFEKTFGMATTANMLIGRYHRLMKEHADLAKQVRGTPSLPVLKFMESTNV